MQSKFDRYYMLLRITSQKYASSLVSEGNIKFGMPENWIADERANGAGRGDRLEGVFASCSSSDQQKISYYRQKYSDVCEEAIGNLIYFRRSRTIHLPCYCIYSLKESLFSAPYQQGMQYISADIPGACFQDFANHASMENVNSLPLEDRHLL